MQSPECSAEPSAADFESSQHTPEQDRRDGVQQNIESVVCQRVKTYKLVERPKRSQNKRIVDRLRCGPDLLQAQRANHTGIACQMRFIIPDKARPEYLVVRDENESK